MDPCAPPRTPAHARAGRTDPGRWGRGGGRTRALIRIARTGQRLLALATAIWHNWTTGARSKRSLIAYDH
ncbi:hypothetical protein DVA86_28000 [Streptomyces armeniacus]|uniref:Transposase n=1 Tax=Streptomyces armeniacus TaxID=83291 RepID=A0A345XW77_9ACTN|nr:hypothetical protein DVA86_28000 [Streptomyces armeniacus]